MSNNENEKLENKKFENAINFLLFSYFKITLDDNANDILDKVIIKAYKDATQQGAFNKYLTDNIKAQIASKSNEKGENILKNEFNKFDNLKNISTQKDFNTWHEKTCKELVGSYNDINKSPNNDEGFTFGNAQKWVNMTIKYIYLLNTVFSNIKGEENNFSKTYGNIIDGISSYIHIPIDNYIIEAVWDMDKIPLPVPEIKEKLPKKGNGKGKYNSEKYKSWSKMDDKEYKNNYIEFQNKLKANIESQTPIEWENQRWIEIAKRRANKESKSKQN